MQRLESFCGGGNELERAIRKHIRIALVICVNDFRMNVSCANAPRVRELT